MTEDDLDALAATLRRVGASLGKEITSELIADAFRDLREFPLEVAEAGLEKCRLSYRFYPRPSQMIAACRELSHRATTSHGGIPAWVDHAAGKFCCNDCEDAGFILLLCDGNGTCFIRGCGKQDHPTHPHTYRRVCACRATNPWLVAERARMQRAPEEAR